ncbi:beta-defensin 114 [Canis lupus baileyi]|nr:beta-defensin 114 [Canis lupus familiaris]XP_025273826.1 beta-defensin 114 [Canis lupus dingo]XP_038409270.1 beta-defensin 114 [Canis lupus familiaris]XP_038538733.1 beta-defensin 114 [Canis lupus familiaris]AAY59721.1 beta-defensin 114 [Canis lupus familiaris]|eukprot:XP_022281478.1 beta-defensin 114 [Canis lupus familiaris]
MKIFYYLLHFLCYVTFILPATCTLIDPDQCSNKFGHCRRRCFRGEKRIDICFLPNKICCIERLYDED